MGSVILDKMSAVLDDQVARAKKAKADYAAKLASDAKRHAEAKARLDADFARQLKETLSAIEKRCAEAGKPLDIFCPHCRASGILFNAEDKQSGRFESRALGNIIYRLRQGKDGVSRCPRCGFAARIM